jgi:hypothetical protein
MMIGIILPALVSAGLVAGCGSGRSSGTSTAPDQIATVVQSEPVPAPRRLSPANDKGVFTMKIGQTAGLVVSDPSAPDPEVDGRSVQVVEVNNVDASGRREWELRAVSPGRTTLRAAGSRPYTITLDVQQ